MKIALVTDSTAYLPDNLLKKYNVSVVPLNVAFENESFREGIDITTKQFYEKVKLEVSLPTTSQPSIGEMVSLYEELSVDYDAVISIHLSKQLSSTYKISKVASKMVENIVIYLVESAINTLPQGFLVIEVEKMINQNYLHEDIDYRLNQLSSKM